MCFNYRIVAAMAALLWATQAHAAEPFHAIDSPADSWRRVPTLSPGREDMLCQYDPIRDRLLIHGGGGFYSGVTSDTWEMKFGGVGRPSPNPTQREIGVSFELPDARPARVELIDVTGRRVQDLEVGSLGAGVHRITLPLSSRLRAGIYSIRLVREGRSLVTRVCVMR
jgi:hypothetical protein